MQEASEIDDGYCTITEDIFYTLHDMQLFKRITTITESAFRKVTHVEEHKYCKKCNKSFKIISEIYI